MIENAPFFQVFARKFQGFPYCSFYFLDYDGHRGKRYLGPLTEAHPNLPLTNGENKGPRSTRNRAMKRIPLIMAALALIVGLSCSTALAVTYSGAWEPTESDINELSVDVLISNPSDFSLWLYDWSEVNTAQKFLDINQMGTSILFTYKTTDNSWYAESGSISLKLGNDSWFGLLFKDVSDNSFTSYDIEKISDPGLYKITMASGDNTDIFVQTDASPIPLPGSVLLLGTGLSGLGLLGWRRRKG